MTEKKVEPAGEQEIRVIDRRSFTSDGDRRQPDSTPVEEPSPAQATPPAAGETDSKSAATATGGGEAVPSAHFQNLVLNLARQAAAHLGAAPSPLSGQVEVDLDAAQHIIDLLNALQQKTRGNVTQEEKEMIEGLIGDLQMQFVTVRSKDPKTS
jgi:hypothetical protein